MEQSRLKDSSMADSSGCTEALAVPAGSEDSWSELYHCNSAQSIIYNELVKQCFRAVLNSLCCNNEPNTIFTDGQTLQEVLCWRANALWKANIFYRYRISPLIETAIPKIKRERIWFTIRKVSFKIVAPRAPTQATQQPHPCQAWWLRPSLHSSPSPRKSRHSSGPQQTSDQ